MPKQQNVDKLLFYREYRDSFIRTKEIETRQSEQRIRFFIALVAGIIAFIGILDKNKIEYFDPEIVVLISLPILIVYGFLTFSQTIWSRHVIYNLDVTIGVLGELIKEIDPTFRKCINKSDLRGSSQIFLKNIKGTFAQYMYVSEGFLVAGFVYAVGSKFNPENIWLTLICAIILPITTFVCMLSWAKNIRNGVKINETK